MLIWILKPYIGSKIPFFSPTIYYWAQKYHSAPQKELSHSYWALQSAWRNTDVQVPPCFHSSGCQKNPQDWTLLWNGMVIITAITLLNWQGSNGKTKTTHISISTQIILLILLCVYSVIPLYQCKWGDRDLLHQSQQKHQRLIKPNPEI